MGFVLVGGGRSPAQASQHRKVDWFSRVHVGQIQALSYELLSAVRSTVSVGENVLVSFVAFDSKGRGLDVAGGAADGPGGGDDSVLGPAGCSWLGGTYDDSYFSRSSS